ncbi:MAG TPA: hypothetical protein VHW91_08660 [Candidatus Dormibacteraeota bacterium]|jgi:hypothetical protein|nr:hypothetical protein [Candidatus Dormibacteraeota bacterium]
MPDEQPPVPPPGASGDQPAGRPAEAPPAQPQPRQGLLAEPAPIFIAAATLFAIFINSANVGVILMLGVVALLLETRLRPKP